MKQDIYSLIYDKIKFKYLSYFLTNIVYFFKCIIFLLKRQRIKKQILVIDYDFAYQLISSKCSKKNYSLNIYNKEIKDDLDLSIICPVFNYEKVISTCIESMINQKTKYNYEIILVDDGSNQETKDILKKYESNYLINVIYQNNMGISGARNTGINSANGKYIMFVDCDDFIHENCVEVMLDEAYKTNNDLVIGSYDLVKEINGHLINRRHIIYSDYNIMNYKDNDIIMNYPGLPWGKLFKRELFNDIRFPVGYWYEDTITQFLIFRKAKSFSYIPKIIYDYKWYEGNYSKKQQTSLNRVIEHYWIYEKMIEENDRIGLERDVILYKTLLRHLGSYLYNAINNLSLEEQQAIFILGKKLLDECKVDKRYHLNFSLRQIEKSYKNSDFSLWVLSSKSL